MTTEPYFAWNPEKAKSNVRKHGVGFREAATVFPDPLAKIEASPDHSEDEARENILGLSAAGRLLVVSFTERGDGIRIISARPATKRERHEYEKCR